MGFLSRAEDRMEDVVEGAAAKMSDTPLSPVQIAKKSEKQMRRNKMVGAGKQYAPTLYTILVNPDDDKRLFGYYPTLAGETETYLAAKAAETGLIMDGQPLVRFIVDDELKHGKFDVVAELVAAPLVDQLRQEEMERYGIADPRTVRPSAPRQTPPPVETPPASAAEERDPFEPQTSEPASQASGGARARESRNNADWISRAGAEAVAEAEQPFTMAFNAPPSPTRDAGLQAYLYDITHDRAFTLTGLRMRIGRGSANEIVIPDINASRLHAEIREDAGGEWLLTDLGSTNGTLVNGRLIKTVKLKDADRITMGTTDLEFQLI